MKSFCEIYFLNDIYDSDIVKNIYSCQNIKISLGLFEKKMILKISNMNAPLNLSRVKQTTDPWVTNEILELFYHRDFLQKS